MDSVEILLLSFVGFVALVYLVLEHMESSKGSKKSYLETERVGLFSDSTKSSDDQREENTQNACFQEIEEEETEAAEHIIKKSSLENSGACNGVVTGNSGNTGGDIVGDMENSENNWERDGEDFDDDWEGIERTELEKLFGEAVVFVSSNSDVGQIDEELKLQLHALQKVALEGPCHGSQPMALKVSARAKWNAWQMLGDMSREVAMEKYASILSNAIPGWKGEGIIFPPKGEILRPGRHSPLSDENVRGGK